MEPGQKKGAKRTPQVKSLKALLEATLNKCYSRMLWILQRLHGAILEKALGKATKKLPWIKTLKLLLEAILAKLWSRIKFWSKLLASTFRVVFQIAFVTPPARIA